MSPPRRIRRPGWPAAALALSLAGGLVGAAQAAAQAVLVELKAGAAVGHYSDTGAGLELLPQPALAALVEVRPVDWLAGYAGFTRASFGCEEGFCADRDVSLTSQGLVLGARWLPGTIWARAGLALQALDVDARGADDRFDPGLGFELAGGVELDLGRSWRLRPGVTYLRHAASTDLGDGHVGLYALEVGVAVAIRGD